MLIAIDMVCKLDTLLHIVFDQYLRIEESHSQAGLAGVKAPLSFYFCLVVLHPSLSLKVYTLNLKVYMLCYGSHNKLGRMLCERQMRCV